jgi:hypothetical protein
MLGRDSVQLKFECFPNGLTRLVQFKNFIIRRLLKGLGKVGTHTSPLIPPRYKTSPNYLGIFLDMVLPFTFDLPSLY